MKAYISTFIGLCSLVFTASLAEARTLKYGDRGQDVAALQTDLEKLDIHPKGLQKGTFADITGDSLQKLQRKHGLRADRIAGKNTKALINKLLSEKNNPVLPTAPKVKEEKMEKIERAIVSTKRSIIRTVKSVGVNGVRRNGIPSYYYVKRAKPGNAPVLDVRGRTLEKVNHRDLELGLIEGTLLLPSGKMANVDEKIPVKITRKIKSGRNKGKKICKTTYIWRWKYTSSKWGLGNNDNPIIPFKSLAVPSGYGGRQFFIPATRGMETPFGTHNGWWNGDDEGEAIQRWKRGIRIDMFIGKPEYAKYLAKAGIRHLDNLTMVMR